MAGTTTSSFDNLGISGNAVRQLVIEFNKLVDDMETLRAKYAAVLTKLDADAGVTDVNYSSLHTVAAATLTAAKIGKNGTAISA